MTAKAWIIFTVVVVALFGGLIFLSQTDKIDVSSVDTNTIQTPSEQNGQIGDHVFGNNDAKVVLVEYGDFQCPGCGSAHVSVKKITEKYKDDLAFVYRNFPLTNIHPNARAAAAAVETAGVMGKYWEMHNLMFETQDEWSAANATDRSDLFAGYAQQIGLNKDDFLKKLDSESTRVNKKISFDQAIGRKLNLTGTPTFYLNGKQVENDKISSEESFEKLITDALKAEGVNIE